MLAISRAKSAKREARTQHNREKNEVFPKKPEHSENKLGSLTHCIYVGMKRFENA
jgi:hypothetical protein